MKRVLLCCDGSDSDAKVLKRGAELAEFANSEVHVLSIVSAVIATAAAYAAAAGTLCLIDPEIENRHSLDDAVARLSESGVRAKGHLGCGNPVDSIAELAKGLSADLIVVGHYPRESPAGWWSGRERTSLAERVDCCVECLGN